MTKSLTYGLLAFAVSTSLALAQEAAKPAAGGWSAKPGSGLKYDGGDAFGLDLKNRLQVHWTYESNENRPDTNSFDVRRLRTSLSGHVFNKNILYMVMFDAVDEGSSEDGNIKQGWVQWNFSSSDSGKVGVRIGQAKNMYGFESTATSAGLWFVERSTAAREFADSYTRGAWLNGVMAENKLRWTLGATNGDVANGISGQYVDQGEEASNSDNELSYVLSANFDPMGDFFGGKQTVESHRQGDWRTDDKELKGTVGAGLALGNGKDATTDEDIESTSININTAWSVNSIQVMGEYFMRTDDLQGPVADEEEPTGWAISGMYLLPKSGDSAMQWGVGLRVNTVETDGGTGGVAYLNTLGAAEGDLMEISAVLNAFYHGHSCKTQVEYTYQDVDLTGSAGDETNHILRIAFQLEF